MEELISLDDFVIEHEERPDGHNQLYFGESKNGKRNGLGVMINDKWVFEGHWENGLRVRGSEKTSVGVYEGAFVYNKRSGRGEFSWKNGDFYVGEWLEGRRHGNGMWRSVKGSKYIGEWQNGHPFGTGVMISEQGSKYEG